MSDLSDARPGAAIAAEVVIGGICVFAVAVTVGILTGASTSTMADWVAAISTFAAFVAAVLAGRYAYGALQLEQERDRLRDELAVRAQASLVAAWYDAEETDTYGVRVRNASELPVTQCSVQVTLVTFDDETQAPTRVPVGTHPLGVVPPATEPVFRRFGYEIEPAVRKLADGSALWDIELHLEFRDAGGRRWAREQAGQLLELP